LAVGRFSGQFLRRTELIKRSLWPDDEPTWWCLEPLQTPPGAGSSTTAARKTAAARRRTGPPTGAARTAVRKAAATSAVPPTTLRRKRQVAGSPAEPPPPPRQPPSPPPLALSPPAARLTRRWPALTWCPRKGAVTRVVGGLDLFVLLFSLAQVFPLSSPSPSSTQARALAAVNDGNKL